MRQALDLWRGAPLSDLAYEPFAQAEIARLEERRWAAFEARVEAELAVGRHADLVSELEAAVAEQPLREHLHGQLMLALYRCGVGVIRRPVVHGRLEPPPLAGAAVERLVLASAVLV